MFCEDVTWSAGFPPELVFEAEGGLFAFCKITSGGGGLDICSDEVLRTWLLIL